MDTTVTAADGADSPKVRAWRMERLREALARYRNEPHRRDFEIQAHLPALKFAALPPEKRERLLGLTEQLFTIVLEG